MQHELVVDANVLVSVVNREPGHERALEAIDTADELFAPELQVYEIANAFTKMVRRGVLTDAEATARRNLVCRVPVAYVSGRRLDVSAFELSLMTGHSAYDCFYLALAIDRRCPLVTFDARLAAAAERIGFGGLVKLV